MPRIALKNEFYCARCNFKTKFSASRRTHVLSFEHQCLIRICESLPSDVCEFNSSSTTPDYFPQYGAFLNEGDRTTIWKKPSRICTKYVIL